MRQRVRVSGQQRWNPGNSGAGLNKSVAPLLLHVDAKEGHQAAVVRSS